MKIKIKKDVLYNLYWNDNLTLKEIAYKYNCSLSTIWKQMKKNSIECRKVGISEGRSLSKERRRRISEVTRGQNNPNYGKHHSKETRRKISENAKERYKNPKNNPFYGKKHSEGIKRKLSEIKKGKKCPKISGKNNYNWKGGITSESEKIRHSLEIKIWREKVFVLGDYICQKCKIRGGKLHAHHIENFSSAKDLRFVINNGITLCKKHHNEFHKIYGRKDNNQDQLNEFLTM